MTDIDPGVRAGLEEYLDDLMAGGETDRGELLDAAEQYLEDHEDGPFPQEWAEPVVGRVWADCLAEQAGWGPGPTDPERLEAVFDRLEETGLTAPRRAFTCCRQCGLSEIADESAPGARGFVFFHGQSARRAAENGRLALYYGGFDRSEETTAAVGREVAAALIGAGLSVEWNGSPDSAVVVTGLRWRVRVRPAV